LADGIEASFPCIHQDRNEIAANVTIASLVLEKGFFRGDLIMARPFKLESACDARCAAGKEAPAFT